MTCLGKLARAVLPKSTGVAVSDRLPELAPSPTFVATEGSETKATMVTIAASMTSRRFPCPSYAHGRYRQAIVRSDLLLSILSLISLLRSTGYSGDELGGTRRSQRLALLLLDQHH